MAQYEINVANFLRYVDETYSPNNARNYHSLFTGRKDNILDMMIKLDKDIPDFTIDDFISVFKNYNVSASSLGRYKRFLEDYLDWLFAQGQVDVFIYNTHFLREDGRKGDNLYFQNTIFKAVSSKYMEKYFRNEDDFIKCVQYTFSEDVTETADNSRFYTYITIWYLLWLGFSTTEILDLENKDVDIAGGRIADKTDIPPAMIEHIYKYSHMSEYARKNKSGYTRRPFIKNGNKLIKGVMSEFTRINFENVTRTTNQLAKKIKATSPYYKKKFSFDGVKRSALFDKVYKEESIYVNPLSETQLMELIKKHSELNNSSSNHYLLKEYLNWKSAL